MWFVPKYVSPQDLGAVLPVTSFATFLAMPVFAFAMTVMRFSSVLHFNGSRGKLKSLLKGVFLGGGAFAAIALILAALLLPKFMGRMRVEDPLAAFLVTAAALLGCVAPVYTDALQALKRFRPLALAEIAGSLARFAALLVFMPIRALAGYFAGQAVLPLVRMATSAIALRRDLAVKAEPFWTKSEVMRLLRAFAAILLYLIVPMGVSLMEQSILRSSLPSCDSAGYYMATRLSDILNYLTFPLLLVLFPYTARAAEKGESTAPYVRKCILAAFIGAAALAGVYAVFGAKLISLLPNGAEYAGYAGWLPMLLAIGALSSAQVFYTNSEVSAGRFGFLKWFVPLHALDAAAMWLAAKMGLFDALGPLLWWFAGFAAIRFACVFADRQK